ncbi:MAG: hypothetical protein QXV62_03055 [Nitrososphaerota archaeon]
MNESGKRTGRVLLNDIRGLDVAFIIDYDLTVRWVDAGRVEDPGQAGYAMSRDLSKAVYWTRVGEDYVLQNVNLKNKGKFYLHHELAPKGTTFEDKLSKGNAREST